MEHKELINKLKEVLSQNPSEEWLINLYKEEGALQVRLPLPSELDFTLTVTGANFIRHITFTSAYLAAHGVPGAVHLSLSYLLEELENA